MKLRYDLGGLLQGAAEVCTQSGQGPFLGITEDRQLFLAAHISTGGRNVGKVIGECRLFLIMCSVDFFLAYQQFFVVGNCSQVWTKVKEEIGEFEAEVENMDKEKAEAEFGDVMFSLINAARLYKINPDNALELTNQKFIRRFNYLEEHTIKQGKNLKDMTLEEMDAIWNEAKKEEK